MRGSFFAALERNQCSSRCQHKHLDYTTTSGRLDSCSNYSVPTLHDFLTAITVECDATQTMPARSIFGHYGMPLPTDEMWKLFCLPAELPSYVGKSAETT